MVHHSHKSVTPARFIGWLFAVICLCLVPGSALGAAAPTTVVDGSNLAADIDYINTSGAMDIAWIPAVDPSGTLRFEWCINNNANCNTPNRTGVTADGTTTSITTAATPVLADGQYFSCVREVDLLGATSAYKCSDKFRVDTVVPTDPTSVGDGLSSIPGTDLDAAPDGPLDITWGAGTDTGSGIAGYDWCISTAANCSSPLRSGSTTGTLVTTTTAATPSLTNGSTYYSCARTRDLAGNTSAYVCSDGFTATSGVGPDTTPPSAPAWVIDGAGTMPSDDIDGTTSTASADLTWDASTDNVGVASYDWCFTLQATCLGAGPTGTTAATTVTTTSGAPYYGHYITCVRARDAAGNTSAYTCSDGVWLDDVVPAFPGLMIDGAYTGPPDLGDDVDHVESGATAYFSFDDAPDDGGSNGVIPEGSGVANYHWCLLNAQDWDCTGALTSGDESSGGTYSLGTLADGTYYICMYSTDHVGLNSFVDCTDGFEVSTTPPPPPPPPPPSGGTTPPPASDSGADTTSAPSTGFTTTHPSGPRRPTQRADVLLGTSGADVINALAGNDVLRGGQGNDILRGGLGRDRIYGDAGRDLLIGGAGADYIRGGLGRDTLVGGTGRDTLDARDGAGGDIVLCGPGRDIVFADRGDHIADDCEVVHRPARR